MLTKSRIIKLSVMLYVIISVILIFTAIFIAWQLFTTKYPTHSDVFWIGVQCGVLGILSLILFTIGLFFLFRLVVRLHKQKIN